MVHYLLVPGYVVRAEVAGPSVFETIGGRPGTDLLGLPQGWGTTFRGKAGVRNWFHFPITNTTVVDDERLACDIAAVTLNLQATDAFLEAVHLWDRTERFFRREGLSVTGDFSNDWSPDQTSFGAVVGEGPGYFLPHIVQGAVGISVLIFFDSPANVTFTGAGIRLRD